jgi:hypothetical protein
MESKLLKFCQSWLPHILPQEGKNACFFSFSKLLGAYTLVKQAVNKRRTGSEQAVCNSMKTPFLSFNGQSEQISGFPIMQQMREIGDYKQIIHCFEHFIHINIHTIHISGNKSRYNAVLQA